MDQLNKKLDYLKKQGKNEDTGPKETEKANLIKVNKEKEEESQNIQKEWMANQTKLVNKQTDNHELAIR